MATPNVLRLVIGEPIEGDRTETVARLSSTVDHRTPEQLAYAAERLLEEGALDVWQAPVAMKKGRVGFEITALARPHDVDRVAAAFLRETGTLGVRREFVQRVVAEREQRRLATSFGSVRFKIAYVGGDLRVRPEHDDCATVARERGLPIYEVEEQLIEEAERLLGRE